jgi:hypothetical protein
LCPIALSQAACGYAIIASGKRAHHLSLDERRYFPNLAPRDPDHYTLRVKLERVRV